MIEEWKDVVGFEGRYRISNMGSVISLIYKKEKVHGISLNAYGYKTTMLRKDGTSHNKLVHRLVAEAFIPNPQGFKVVDHIDRNRSNAIVTNLQWTTHTQNAAHLEGGPKGASATLSEENVRKIFTEFHTGIKTRKQLSQEHRIGLNTVGEIVRRQAWPMATMDLAHLIQDRVPPPMRHQKGAEKWAYVRDFPDYIVSDRGNVISFHREDAGIIITLDPAENHKGYFMVSLQKNNRKKWYSIHRLVALHFIENPKQLPIVHHIDGDKKNNRVENLQWCDNTFNITESFKNGRIALKGSRHPNAKLNENSVRDIRTNFDGHKFDYQYFASKYCVSVDAIVKVIKREHWKHVT